MKIKLFTLPNMITLLNLLLGSVAVVSMISLNSQQALTVAFYCMLAAGVCDFMDGFVARLTKSYSAVGVQLDSLADMVSFGLLPGVIAMKIFFLSGGQGLWGAVPLVIVLFSALRLAKFNVDDSQKSEFVGLPTPANALLIGAVGFYVANNNVAFAPSAPWLVLVCCVLLAWLLISPVRMFSLKFNGFGFRGNAVRYIFLLCSLAFIIIFGLSGIAPAIILYILSSVIMWLIGLRRKQA